MKQNQHFTSAVLLVEAGLMDNLGPILHPDTAKVIADNVRGVETRISELMWVMGLPIEHLQGVLTNELKSRVMARVTAALDQVTDGRIPIVDHWAGREPPLESFIKIAPND